MKRNSPRKRKLEQENKSLKAGAFPLEDAGTMTLTVKDENFGPYEKRLCILLLLATMPNAFPHLQALVTQYTPSHHCDVIKMFNVTNAKKAAEIHLNESSWKEKLMNLTIPWKTDYSTQQEIRSQCSVFNVTRQQLIEMIQNPAFNYSKDVIPCEMVDFESERVSAVTELGMVCDESWQKPLTTSAYMIGLMVGGLVGGAASDAFGRKTTFLIFTFLQFIVVFAASFVTDVAMHFIMMFLIGMASLVNFVSAVVLGSEFMPTNVRILSYLALEVGFSIGSMLFAPLAFGFSNWRWYLRFTGLIGVLYIPYIWLIDESPEWLSASGKKEEAKLVLQKIAKFNHKQPMVGDEALISAGHNIDKKQMQFVETLKVLIMTPRMLRRFLIVIFSWFIASLSYYTMKLNMNKLPGDRFWNLFYGGVTELLATFVFYAAVETRGRRQAYMISMVATSVLIIVASLVAAYSGTLATALALTSQLLISVAFNVVYVYTGELFPTKSRQSMLGMNAIGARIGGFAAPYLIFASDSGSTLAPSLGNAAAIIFSVITFAFLPETRRSELPLNVEEALDLPGGLIINQCKVKQKKNTQNAKDEMEI